MNANKQAAVEAMEEYDSIKEKTLAASGKAEAAKQAMEGADVSASLALTVALEAQDISTKASSSAATISREARFERQTLVTHFTICIHSLGLN